jgi:ribonuclease HII
MGLTLALQLAGRRAVQRLGCTVDAIILDGVHNYLMLDCHTQLMPKADQTSLSVAAASIVAKVARDRYMELLHRCYPQYGFDRHRGYLTRAHVAAIRSQGLTPLHRRRWSGLEAYALNG